MTHIDLTTQVTIARPADEVWRVLSAYACDPEWRTGVRSMTCSPAGPVTVGTTTDEQLRFGGRTYRNLGEVTAVQPGVRFSWRTTEGADASGARTVVPAGEASCHVVLELLVRPKGSERLLRPLLAMMLRRNLQGDGERLRALLETRGVGDTSGLSDCTQAA